MVIQSNMRFRRPGTGYLPDGGNSYCRDEPTQDDACIARNGHGWNIRWISHVSPYASGQFGRRVILQANAGVPIWLFGLRSLIKQW
jgi:hypothetical protein